MMTVFGKRALFLLLSVIATPGFARADITPETRWADPSRVQLNVEFPGDGYHASWELFRCDCGDLLVRSELNVPGEVEKGETLLVGGKAVLSRGFGKRQAELGASLDAPALMMQVALRLRERAEPGGPANITTAVDVDLEDTIHHINLDTGAAVGGFRAPWKVEGSIAPPGHDQRRFDLRFTFSVGVEGEVQLASMRLSGLADFADHEFPLPGSTAIGDWFLTWRDEERAASAIPGTLDELRAVIGKD